MRGVLVSFGTILLTSLLIFYSGIESDAKRSNSFSVESAEINFENTGGTYIGAYNENEKAYSWKPLDTESGLAEGGDTFYFRKLSAVDGVYSESDSTGSIIVTEIATGSAKIEIGSGRYVFSLQDPFRSYEVVTNTATFRPLGAGTFFIDNRDERHAAYSFSALLEVSLPLDTKTTATKFTLFPTLLFEYDPRYTRSLRGADMLRIATVDSIRSLDARKEEPLADIVWFTPVDPDEDRLSDNAGDRDDDPTMLLSLAMEDIAERSKKYSEIFSDLLSFEVRSVDGSEFIEQYPELFINPSKKDVYNRRALLLKLSDLLSRDYRDEKSVAECEEAILALLSEIRSTDAESYERARSMIRVSSYLWMATRMLHRESDLLAHVAEKHRFSAFIAKVFPEDTVVSQFHGTISDIYASYFFGPLIEKNVHKFLNDYLADTVENKRIEQRDFLYFGFFLIEYLQEFDDAFSKDAFDIAYSLIRIMDEYYLSASGDLAATARAPLLSTVFYNYSVVLDHLVSKFRDEVFTREEEYLVLRDEWVSWSKSAIPESVVKSLSSLADMLSSKNGNMVYLEDKETSMQSLLAFRGTNLSSNRDKLFRSLTETKRLVEIIRTYPEYLQKIQLSDDYGESFDFSEPKVLDAAELREYLSQFNGVNADQLRIVNLASMQEDGYFHVKVPVKGNAFEFKLDPDGHVLYETTFTTPKGELVTTYKGYVVNLDEKADQLSKLGRSAGDDERKKFLFDFKNVFDNMFFYVQEPGDIPIQGIKIARDNPEQSEVPAETSGMSAETQIFIERELMRKDFNYIAETLKIGFNDVYATIVNGKYDITVRPIFLSVMGDQMSQIQFSAKYDFAAHSFVDVEIKAFDKNSLNPQPKLGGRTIRFANPSNLFIKSVKERIGELGFYIEAAESVISQSPADGDIMIDFVNKTVTIGSRTVPVNTSPVR